MEPTLKKNDAILVKKVPINEIKKNDIISFSKQGVNVTHRVVGIEEEEGVIKYTTKGDNNNTEDSEKVIYSQIEGKYVDFKINGFGTVINILKNRITLFLLIIAVVIIYTCNFIRKRK